MGQKRERGGHSERVSSASESRRNRCSAAWFESLSRFANSLGRRADVVTVLWQDMERRRKAAAKAAKVPKEKEKK